MSWGLDAVAYSETSHTAVASRVIRTSFRKLGWKVLLGQPVRDKFATKSGAGSLRGLSKGVALASKWPCYDVVPGSVPLEVWQGGRIHLGCFHVGQFPIHVLTLYLVPNAPPGSFNFEVNNAVLSWASTLCLGLVGPVLVCGDFNSPLSRWPAVRGLLERGWVDLGLLQAEVNGEEPQSTCLGVVRHSFHIANSALVRFWRSTYVMSAPDLDKHDVLVSDFDVPCRVPRVPKWVLPRSFLEGPVDKTELDRQLTLSHQSCVESVDEALVGNDVAGALAKWSHYQERAFAEASCHCDGEKRRLTNKYFGRCQRFEPKMVQLSLPRCKTGRPGDYQPPHLTASTHVRQLVRQTRRLQRLWHILAHREGPVLKDAVDLWASICSGTGFGKSFPKWCFTRLGWFPVQFPSSELVGEIYQEVREFSDDASRKAWALKREAFASQLEDSCAREGSSLPCKLIKEETQPIVTEMKIQQRLELSPQRWLPGGKAWIKVKNTAELSVGDSFSCGEVTTQIMETNNEAVRLDRLVSRREAMDFVHTKVEVDPIKWTGHFMESWENFWQRDQEHIADADMQVYIDMVPQLPEFQLEPITGAVLHEAIRGLKKVSMRGCDGWAYGELKLLPESSLNVLAKIFVAIEHGAPWPKALSQWFLVLLRKGDDPVPSWDQIRPISVSAGLYRLWARIRAKEMLKILSGRPTGLIKPNLPTTAIWGMLSDYLDWSVGRLAKPAGLVLDIVKAFNCLHRPLLGCLLRKLGLPNWLWPCWERALTSMTRRVQLCGFHYQASTSSTGIPEGDPLALGGMYAYSFLFGAVIRGLSNGGPSEVCPVTYADNWEIWCARLGFLIELLDPIAVFLRTCRLPISVEKCWGWCVDPVGRKRLKQCQFDNRTLPVVLSAKCLGADIAYSYRTAATTRNKRVRAGGVRLVRLAGLPLGFHRRVSIVRMSVWKQALHGAAIRRVCPPLSFENCELSYVVGLRLIGQVVLLGW